VNVKGFYLLLYSIALITHSLSLPTTTTTHLQYLVTGGMSTKGFYLLLFFNFSEFDSFSISTLKMFTLI